MDDAQVTINRIEALDLFWAIRTRIRDVSDRSRTATQWGRRPNSLSPVSPSRCSGYAHTRNQRSPFGVNHRPVHDGVSSQWVA